MEEVALHMNLQIKNRIKLVFLYLKTSIVDDRTQ